MLTAKQEKFAQCIALEEMNYSEAYRTAYNTSRMTDKSVTEKASELAKNVKVTSRIAELREQLASPKIMTARDRLEWLTEVVKDKEQNMRDRLSASDQMNKMQGEYVQKIEADVNQDVVVVIDLVE
jgi:phage terminase small subunit